MVGGRGCIIGVGKRGEPRGRVNGAGMSICIGLKGYLGTKEPDLGRPKRGLARERSCSGSSTWNGVVGERRGGSMIASEC